MEPRLAAPQLQRNGFGLRGHAVEEVGSLQPGRDAEPVARLRPVQGDRLRAAPGERVGSLEPGEDADIVLKRRAAEYNRYIEVFPTTFM
jgi:hypothetical protein